MQFQDCRKRVGNTALVSYNQYLEAHATSCFAMELQIELLLSGPSLFQEVQSVGNCFQWIFDFVSNAGKEAVEVGLPLTVFKRLLQPAHVREKTAFDRVCH